MYEVFSTAPAELQIWKQVPSLEEAVELAKYLVEQHEGSTLNVWHPQEGQVYQAENINGEVNVLIELPTIPQEESMERIPSPTGRGDWPEQMGEYWQQRYSSPNMIQGAFWLRLGDQGDYEPYKDIQELAAYLKEYDAQLEVGPILGWVEGGFETEFFSGNNYVSVYVGDDNADLLRELSPREKRKVEKVLEREGSVQAQVSKFLVDGAVYRSATDTTDDVGFSGFVDVLDNDNDGKKMPDDHYPQWVMESMRESKETIPEVTDEDLVKTHG
jgi:hypothetical protein